MGNALKVRDKRNFRFVSRREFGSVRNLSFNGFDSCQIREKYGVCVGNCSLGFSGVCGGFIRRDVFPSGKVVSIAMSKKQSVSEIPVTSEPATKRPELTGDLTVGRYQDKRKVGTISLWVQTANLGTSKPVFQGNVNVDGAKSYVVAWLHGYHLVKDDV